MARKSKKTGVAAIEEAATLRFQLDDPEQAAVNEPIPADQQQALDDVLHDPEAAPVALLPAVKRVDSRARLLPGDERCKYEHELDTAPRNSKIVRTERGAVIATPAGSKLLLPFDCAQQLPLGIKVTKLGEGSFRASIPNAEGAFDLVSGVSVIQLIADTLARIHGEE